MTIVTASLDRVELRETIIPYFDLELKGNVTCVGKSSMEVRILVTSKRDGEEKVVLHSFFTMVAKDKYTHKAAEVHGMYQNTFPFFRY